MFQASVQGAKKTATHLRAIADGYEGQTANGRRMYNILAAYTKQSTLKNFAAGGRPQWRKFKDSGRRVSPLVVTGNLKRKTIQNIRGWDYFQTRDAGPTLRVVTPFYGKCHQTGTRKRYPESPHNPLPARKFLQYTKPERKYIANTILASLLKGRL